MLMSRASILIFLGVFVILTPFSGLPVAIRTLLTVIFGASVLGIGFALRVRDVRMKKASPVVEPPSAPEPPAEMPRSEPQGVSPI